MFLFIDGDHSGGVSEDGLRSCEVCRPGRLLVDSLISLLGCGLSQHLLGAASMSTTN